MGREDAGEGDAGEGEEDEGEEEAGEGEDAGGVGRVRMRRQVRTQVGRSGWARTRRLGVVPPSVPGQVLQALRVGLCKPSVFREDKRGRTQELRSPKSRFCWGRAGGLGGRRDARRGPHTQALAQTCSIFLPSLLIPLQ